MDAVAEESWMLETAPGVALRVERFGAPGDPVVILISGAGAPAAFWPTAVCRDLASDGLQIVRFDHRDTGASTHLDHPYPIETLLCDVWRVVAEIGAVETHLVGHSMGGYLVAMALADDRRSQIASGIAISAGPASDPERYAELGMTRASEATWSRLMENTPGGAFEADLQGWLAIWRFLNASRPFSAGLATAYTRALYTGDPRNAQVAVNHVHAMTTLPRDLPERLAGIQAPLLVVHGGEDPLAPPDNGAALNRLTPGSRLHMLDRAGHMFFSEQTWAELAALITEAVRRERP